MELLIHLNQKYYGENYIKKYCGSKIIKKLEKHLKEEPKYHERTRKDDSDICSHPVFGPYIR